jgi:hypothetical protein
MEDWENTR